MSSERDSRQRAAARARLEREMAARRESARRKRLLLARIGAGVAGAVVLGAVVWIIVAASGGNEPAPTPTAAGPCVYLAEDYPTADPAGSPVPLPSGVKDVGTPPAEPPSAGFQVITFETNLGKVEVEMDLSKARCTANSIAYLASKGFYDSTSCHRLVTTIFALQCGDPGGASSGGATYRFDNENDQLDKLPAYHTGDVAMANTGQPGSNGSQFFFVYDTSGLQGGYSLFGRVITGLDIIKQVAAAGDNGEYGGPGDGRPNQPFTFTKVTAGPITATSAATAAPSPSDTSPSPSPTTSPSPAAS